MKFTRKATDLNQSDGLITRSVSQILIHRIEFSIPRKVSAIISLLRLILTRKRNRAYYWIFKFYLTDVVKEFNDNRRDNLAEIFQAFEHFT